jgi:hypothetical protein
LQLGKQFRANLNKNKSKLSGAMQQVQWLEKENNEVFIFVCRYRYSSFSPIPYSYHKPDALFS